MKENGKYWQYIFFAVLLAELIAVALNWQSVQWITKPLLVAVLFTWFIYFSPRKKPLRIYIAAALCFSWLGDVFLLMDSRQPLWFMTGLASFLLAHILYILFFLKTRKKQTAAKPWNIAIIIAIAFYVGLLLALLLPHTGALKIPVVVYALTIGTMLATALHAFSKQWKQTAFNCSLGAALFVVSDSLLAINKFYQPFAGAGVLIMLSYGLAQFAITKGCLQYLAGE
ncbi:MAG: lysoplasmalogenase [Chitinophagaceae bacterium]